MRNNFSSFIVLCFITFFNLQARDVCVIGEASQGHGHNLVLGVKCSEGKYFKTDTYDLKKHYSYEVMKSYLKSKMISKLLNKNYTPLFENVYIKDLIEPEIDVD